MRINDRGTERLHFFYQKLTSLIRITSEKRLKDYWENDPNFEQSGRLWIT
jgi:hypothetical protein